MTLTLKERQRQMREDAILDAARSLMEEQGYAEMSMDDLASRVGISKATLYQHFSSKDSLIARVMQRGMQRGLDDMAAQDPALPAVVRLERFLKAALRRRATLWSAQSALPPAVTLHPEFKAQKDRMVEALTRLVDEGKAQGDITPTIATPVMVHALQSLFRTDYETLMQDGQLSLDEVSEQLVHVVLNGLRNKETV